MRITRNLLTLCVALTASCSVFAQGEWLWNNQAYFQNDSSSGGLLWMHFDYHMGSSSLTNSLLNEAIFQAEITPETARETTDSFDGDVGRAGGYAEGEIWYRSGGQNWSWIAGAGFRELFGARLENDLFRLYLRGNAPYADETLALGPSQLYYSSHQFMGLGLERASEKFTWGFTLNLLKVSRYQSVDLNESDLFTAPFGEFVESNVDLTYETTGSNEAKLSAWYGTGVTLNTYFQWNASERTAFYGKVKDLGFLQFEGLNTSVLDTAYRFEGADVGNILQLDDSLFEDGSLDSLEALLGLRTTNESQTKMAPGYFMIGLSTSFSEKVGLNLELRQWWRAAALPQLRVGLPLRLSERFTVEPSLRLGGWNTANSGLSLAYEPFDRLLLVLRSEQFENLLVSDNSSGQSLMVGGMLRF